MLLDGIQFQRQLFDAVSSIEDTFVVFSAFIKERALTHSSFIEKLKDKEVTIVARWEKRDLQAGASDLSVYQVCKDMGWKFGINLNLHGKLYLIDKSEIFLGSANLTQKGLHIGLDGNFEFGTRIPAQRADLGKVQDFIQSEVTWIDDELFSQLEEELSDTSQSETPVGQSVWSDRVLTKVYKQVEYLWVNELVFTSPHKLLSLNLNDECVAHDFDLLNLNIDDISPQHIRNSFKKTRLFGWIHGILQDEGDIHFGGLTRKLHDALLDDPKPYRIDIKNYNQTIFEWAEFLEDTFKVHRPNYSQVLSLRER